MMPREDRLPRASTEADRLRNAARQACGEWLGEYAWDHFVTLTFADPISPESAAREFRVWLRWMEQRARRPLSWFYVRETGAAGFSHFHSLVYGTSHLPCSSLRDAWIRGHSHAVVYDGRRRATHYVSKEVAMEAADFDLDLRNARPAA